MKDFEQRDAQCPLTVESDSNDNLEQFNDVPTNDILERATRYELLSAYIDGEVTVDERRQVQQWLDTDPQLQKLYTQLLRLQQDIKQVPVPVESQEVDRLVGNVFEKIDRQKNQKFVLVGGALLTAFLVSVASYWLPGRNSFQIAHHVNMSEADSEPLMIALNQPIVEIPLLDVSNDGKTKQ